MDENQTFDQDRIIRINIEEEMKKSYIDYSMSVIVARALPDVRDGFKPVHRRILYGMMGIGNTSDKPYKKCARVVGEVLGKYHPHGDSSVYGALVRMAQSWNMRYTLVDGQGNFGSVDGDSPAAMRYTEARMTNLAVEMLRDIDKDTVDFHLNFDDTQNEPDLLPSSFPNILVNGADGIAVGLATNIPPHNLGECIDGCVALMENPSITTQELMKYIPGPDFPTGGVMATTQELYQAYETGRGKVPLRAKVSIEPGSSGRTLLVMTEMTYGKNKAALLEKILRLSEEKKDLFSDIYDIRDESDRTGMRAVIELKRDADAERVLAALYKYSELQDTFGINMVCIANGKPMQLGLKAILEYYIRHRKDVVLRRTRYELDKAKARAHILEGLIIAVDNLDEVIRLIRSSKNPKEAKERLMARFALTDIQAQAILDMRLQRLTNLEILTLRQEYAEVLKLIEKLEAILKSEKKLMKVIKDELLEVKEKYATPRRTLLVDGFEEKEIEPLPHVADETLVYLSRSGFIKRVSPRLYEKSAAAGEETDTLQLLPCDTDARVLFFTDLGFCYSLPVDKIPECRLKDRGTPPGALLAGLEKDEHIVSALLKSEGEEKLLFVSEGGIVKRTSASEYAINRARFQAISLKKDDKLKCVMILKDESSLLILTQSGMSIHFRMEEVSVIGRSAAGVKGISLAPGDSVAYVFPNSEEGEILLASEKGYMKRVLLIDFDLQARGGKGVKCFTFLKNGSNGTCLSGALLVKEPFEFSYTLKSGESARMSTDVVRIERRESKGTMYVMCVLDDVITEISKAPVAGAAQGA